MIAPRCDEHSGFCEKMEGQDREIKDLKTSNGEQWKEINKKTSTATLLIIVGIVASVIMGIAGLMYSSNDKKITALETADSALRTHIDQRYDKIDEKLDKMISHVRNDSHNHDEHRK